MRLTSFQKLTFAFAATLATGIAVSGGAVKAAPVEYTSGHGDIGLAFEDGELELHYHFDNTAVLDGSSPMSEIEFEPDEIYVRLGDDTRGTATSSIAFLGLSAGDDAWVLPQNFTTGLPFLGIAADELDSTFSAASLSLTSFSGPGEFAIWQTGGLSGTSVRMQTNDGVDEMDDVVNLSIGGHDHYNYGFTAEGVYTLGISAEAELAAGGSVIDFGELTFVVGSATAVPEPTSMAALAVIGGVAAVRRRRRR